MAGITRGPTCGNDRGCDVEISISVDVGGALRHLTDVQNRIPRALEQGLKDSAALLRREMAIYPPRRAGSTYKRQNILKRSWFIGQTQRFPGGVSVRVYSSGDSAPYNVFVQKASMQATIHRGLWGAHTEVAVATRLQPHFVRMIENRVSAVMR